MRNMIWDKPKSVGQLKKELGKTCSNPGCNNVLTHMKGPGSGVLCREHQLKLTEYGGMGRIDRPHTFHRKWTCVDCGYNPLEDPRVSCVEDEEVRLRIGRSLMHGDHLKRKADGGDDSVDNIQSLCYVCHAKKTVLNEDYKR